jgi:hypothetical protein
MSISRMARYMRKKEDKIAVIVGTSTTPSALLLCSTLSIEGSDVEDILQPLSLLLKS